jgi:hypothetical protein
MTDRLARTLAQRKADTLERLEHDVDCWVATADLDGVAYLVPLSFRWDGKSLLLATPASSPTGRNLQARGKVRLGVGETRDVVLIEGDVSVARSDELSGEEGDAFAGKTGFDPRDLTGYLFFRIQPRRVQAWREANELAGRDLMRDGQWLS